MSILKLLEFTRKASNQKLSIKQLHILGYLALKENYRATLSELAAETGISTAAITGQIDTLEGRLLLERHHPQQDRRTIYACLTLKGLELLPKEFNIQAA